MLRVIICAALMLAVAKAFVVRVQLPPYIERCSKSDENLNECFVQSGNRAIPELIKGDARFHIPSMEPYQLDEVVLRDDNEVRFVMTNVEVYGLEGAKLTGVNLDFDNAEFAQNLTIPRLRFVGDYEINGRVLDEFIQGEGRANITIVNGLYNTHMRFTIDNNRAVPIQSHTSYRPQIVVYDLQKLYGGNEFRSYQTNIYLNNNWRQVDQIFSEGAAEYIMNDLITLLYKNIGSIVTADELYLS